MPRIFDNIEQTLLPALQQTLRKRLAISDNNYPMASRIIKDTIEVELIMPHGESVGSKKDASYVPFWA